MQLSTTRFGVLTVEPNATVLFPDGLPGLEDCRRWALVTEQGGSGVAWLQSVERADTALAVVSPRQYVPDFEVRATRWQLAPLEINDPTQVAVLAIISANDSGLTLNLKAPLVINLHRRLGKQVICAGNWPIDHPVTTCGGQLRKSA